MASTRDAPELEKHAPQEREVPDWNTIRSAAVASLECGLWSLDHDTGLLEWDEAMESLLRGEDPRTVRGWVDQALASRRVGPLACGALGDFRSDPIRFELAGGEPRWVRLAWRTEKDGNGTIRSAGVARDITADVWLQRRLSQAERLEAVGRVSAGVAHNFNNILAIITACLGELEHTLSESPGVPAAAHKDLTDALEATRRAEDVIASIAQVARLERAPDNVVQDVAMICEHSLELFRRTAPEVNLVAEIDAVTHVACAPGTIEQVVDNLLANARDALGDRTDLSASIRLEVRDKVLFGAPYVAIEVIDNGPGVPESVAETIFDPFVTTKGSMGTGLGLATVAAMVERIGGHVVYRPAAGGGAHFRVLLPAVEPSPLGRKAPSESRPVLGGRRILLVDDEEAVAHALARGLRRNGHEAEFATCAEGARVALRGNFDIVLLDRSLGRTDGRDLIEEVRLTQPSAKVFFFTGEILSDEDARLVDGVLQKPMRLQDLIQRLGA